MSTYGPPPLPIAPPPPPPPRRKRHTGLIIAASVGGLLLVGLIAAVVGLFVLTSNVLGPRDLGVQYSEKDYWSTVSKVGIDVKAPDQSEDWTKTKMTYSGRKKVDVTLSPTEVSALFNYSHVSDWPIRNAQVVFVGTNGVQLAAVLDVAGRDFPIYVEGTAHLRGATISGSLTSASVLGWSVPKEYLGSASDVLVDIVNSRLARLTNLNITEADVSGGQLHLVGTIPAKAERTGR